MQLVFAGLVYGPFVFTANTCRYAVTYVLCFCWYAITSAALPDISDLRWYV